MRGGNLDRLWLIGGALGAVVLVALAWLLLIGPQNGDTATLRDQESATQDRIAAQRHRLSELRRDSAKLPEYQAQLQRDRQALPDTPALADFLRELQSAGDQAGAPVTSVVVGTRARVPAAGSPVDALTLSVAATGSRDQLNRLLDQLQQQQPRAVLVDSVRTDSTGGGPAKLNLTLRIFVAAQTAPASPQPSTPVR
jgi:Tfp pilus assembly protein PilO